MKLVSALSGARLFNGENMSATFIAKLGLRKYMFYSDVDYETAQEVYDAITREHGDTCDQFEIQNMFEDEYDAVLA